MSIASNKKRYYYWINERESIRVNREELAMPAPWTDDPILQNYKFTNVFRQDDRTTRALLQHLDDHYTAPLGEILFNIVLFRYFNYAPTYEAAGGWKKSYNSTSHRNLLKGRKALGQKIFTGAYVVTNNGSPINKIDLYCDALTEVHAVRNRLADTIAQKNSVEEAVRLMTKALPLTGRFVAYEFACDMTYTRMLRNACDRYTWANPGPGAKRGLNRIFRGAKDAKPKPATDDHYVKEMQELYKDLHANLNNNTLDNGHPIDMRVIENGLCEFDKYERVRLGEGRPRSKYKGA